jgi:hypothetical protein
MAGLAYNQFNNDVKRDLLKIFRRGINGNTTFEVRSVKKQDRLRVIERVFGKLDKPSSHTSLYQVEIDQAARSFYSRYRKPDGGELLPERISEYTSRASIFNAMREGIARRGAAHARCGSRLKKSALWKDLLAWYTSTAIEYGIPVFSNERSLERAYKAYLNDGYTSLIHKSIGNDSRRVVSAAAGKLPLALYRTNDNSIVQFRL